MSEDEIVDNIREGMIEFLEDSYNDYLMENINQAISRLTVLSAELKEDIWNPKLENAMLLNISIYKENRKKLMALSKDDGDYFKIALRSIFIKVQE